MIDDVKVMSEVDPESMSVEEVRAVMNTTILSINQLIEGGLELMRTIDIFAAQIQKTFPDDEAPFDPSHN